MIDNVEDALEEQRAAHEADAALARGFELQRVIDFGFQVQQFKDGEIGRRILSDAIVEKDELTRAFLGLDVDNPDERNQMRDIRHRIAVIDGLWLFVDRYIREGREAQAQFVSEDQPD